MTTQYEQNCIVVQSEVWVNYSFGNSSQKLYKKIAVDLWDNSLRYSLRIWWPNIASNKDLRKGTGQEDINLETRKRQFRWIGHTLKERMGKYQRLPYCGILKEAGKEEDLRIAGEDRLSNKRVEGGMN
jgi:hypothetical protein